MLLHANKSMVTVGNKQCLQNAVSSTCVLNTERSTELDSLAAIGVLRTTVNPKERFSRPSAEKMKITY
ncbi:hypothetical protein GN956_G8783 [Arapaima gigas]